MSGVLTYVGCPNPSRELTRLPAHLITVRIWSRTVQNSWETWKIRLGEVFYSDKTTPLYIYERIMAD